MKKQVSWGRNIWIAAKEKTNQKKTIDEQKVKKLESNEASSSEHSVSSEEIEYFVNK